MGFGSWLKSKGQAIAAGVSSLKRKFTGEDKIEEANDRYQKLVIAVEMMQKDFGNFTRAKESSINQNLLIINNLKDDLYNVDFKEFIELMDIFSGWNIEENLFKEVAKFKDVKVGEVRNKSELILLDFENHPIKENLKALFTLGFLTRKRAKQSLLNVKTEEARFEEEKEKIKAEEKRLELIDETMSFIAQDFKSFYIVYRKLLKELKYITRFIKNSYLIKDPLVFNDKVDIYFLPKEHIKLLMICEKFTRVMHGIASKKYLSSSLTLKQTDVKDFKEIITEAKDLKIKMAV